MDSLRSDKRGRGGGAFGRGEQPYGAWGEKGLWAAKGEPGDPGDQGLGSRESEGSLGIVAT